MKKLFAMRGTLPFLMAVFLNAFVDLGHKIVIQNTIFKMYDGSEQIILTAIVNGLILLPFIMLFSPAGFASDRYSKAHVMKMSAWAAVILTCGITVCYAMGWFWPAFGMTFLLAAQSAFYSPAKYGYIKTYYGKERLAEINGVVQAISIIAILAGTLAFSALFEAWFPAEATSEAVILQAIVPVGFLLVINSVFELLMVYRLPNPEAPNPNLQFDVKRYLGGRLIKENLAPIWRQDPIRLSIIGLAVFWSIGQVMLAAFPAFAKAQTGELNTVVIQAIIAASGIGIALGSAIASRMSRNYIETGLIPFGAIGIATGLFILPSLESLQLMAACFLFIGAMGGIFIVPLNALIQYHAQDDALGKTLSASNFVQNIAMLCFLILTVISSMTGVSGQTLLASMGVLALIGGFYTIYKLPQSLVRILISVIMSRHYKLNVQGMRNVPQQGGVLLLGNHISWIDWAVIQMACPRPVQFVMLKSIYNRWYLNWFFKLFQCIPISANAGSRDSLTRVAESLSQGNVVCLFPEGMISRNGHLSDFRGGFELSAKMVEEDIKIVPFYSHGLWGSHFSRASEFTKNLSKRSWKRQIIVSFGQPLDKDTKADVVKRRVFDLSIDAWKAYVGYLENLPESWINTCKVRGSKLAIADTLSEPLTANRALTAAVAFSRRIKKISPEQNIGLLVPTSAGGVLSNMAGLIAGKTLVNLNYTASKEAFASSIEQAEVKTVYTSKRFLKKLSGRGIDFSDTLESVNVVYLEALKEDIGKGELLRTLLAVNCLPAFMLKALWVTRRKPDDIAAILFSSGSEGLPKGIQLSHSNIMANLKQISSVLNAQQNDTVMASLPLFHAFGLTVTQFMPLIEGMPMVCHADPTDALGVAKAVAKYRATLLCGTSTFLRLYCKNRKVHPLMLDSLRFVVAGAEKLNPDVRNAFELKFKKHIYEGFGATETSPVASVNVPDLVNVSDWRVQQGEKTGTVGMPLPGANFKIVDPNTFEELPTGEDGMILISGVQVMQGYLNNPKKSQEAIQYIGGMRWYVSGDKGHVDKDGFLTIVDRYSRFAKVGGEMISLSAVEQTVREALQQHMGVEELEVVAVNLPDAKKGEQIILLTDIELDANDIRKALLDAATNPLMIPSGVKHVSDMPKLGSGKTDFTAAKKLAQPSEKSTEPETN